MSFLERPPTYDVACVEVRARLCMPVWNIKYKKPDVINFGTCPIAKVRLKKKIPKYHLKDQAF